MWEVSIVSRRKRGDTGVKLAPRQGGASLAGGVTVPPYPETRATYSSETWHRLQRASAQKCCTANELSELRSKSGGQPQWERVKLRVREGYGSHRSSFENKRSIIRAAQPRPQLVCANFPTPRRCRAERRPCQPSHGGLSMGDTGPVPCPGDPSTKHPCKQW